MYIDSDYYEDLDSAKDLVRNIEPLLIQAKVDLGLWGHHHSYQRTCHVTNATCDGQEKKVRPCAVAIPNFRI